MQCRHLFPSPVFFDQPVGQPSLRRQLRALLDAAPQPPDLFTSTHPPVQALRRLVEGGMAQVCQQQGMTEDMLWSVRGWHQVFRHGEYLAPCVGDAAHWQGLYVVDCGDTDHPPPTGCLSFLDPHGTRHSGQLAHHDLVLADGLLLIFPGWLVHHIHPYMGQKPRTLVFFEVTKTKPSAALSR